MEAIALFLLLANMYLCTTTYEVENIYSENGWKPISNERVFKDYWNSKISSTALSLHSSNNGGDFINVVDAPKLNEELMVSNTIEPTRNFVDNIQGTIPGMHIVLPINRKVSEIKNIKPENLNNNPFRRGKMIEPKSNAKNKIIERKHDDIINEEVKLELNNNTYKVTENTDEEDLFSADQNIFSTKNSHYEVSEEKRANNFTDRLLKILSNYNIRTSDRLPNYALSLRHNSQTPNTGGYVYMRVPIRIPLKYNSANHASVDPILAVFLSNYGHYLPGLFGFRQNYKNLYGYSASNNIHNNKPFGAYKIFSDTDSSL